MCTGTGTDGQCVQLLPWQIPLSRSASKQRDRLNETLDELRIVADIKDKWLIFELHDLFVSPIFQ